MKLMEAIVDANHRALAGDAEAGLRPEDYADSLPIVALSCIDVRLNPLLPQVLGVPPEQFIWLRNAGNIITGPVSSTMRSLALACAVKGGREIAVIGHTDCAIGRLTTMELIERFRALGIERASLPENLNDYFGTFASESANVIKAVDLIRGSPLTSPRMAVHGLVVDLQTGKLDWVVNGYQTLGLAAPKRAESARTAGKGLGPLEGMIGGGLGEMKFPEGQVGDAPKWTAPPPPAASPVGGSTPESSPPHAKLPLPPRLPRPPPLKRGVYFRR